MATMRKSLGRGLSALIPDNDMDFLSRVARGDSIESVLASEEVETELSRSAEGASKIAGQNEPEVTVPVRALVEWVEPAMIEPNPFQPRRIFAAEEMRELVDSVREHGILQPVLLRPLAGATGQQFQLVAGERRWRAASEAGLEKIPAIIREVSDQQSLELALIENVQRHDISVLDAATAYKRLADDFKLSQADIAQRVGKSRSAVANTLRLLDLPDEVQKALEDGVLSEGHGRAILGAPGEGAQRAIFRRILRDKLSVREAERLARMAVESGTGANEAERREGDSKPDRVSNAAEHLKVARMIQEKLGAQVAVRARAKGGQITIRCRTHRDFERVTKLLSAIRE